MTRVVLPFPAQQAMAGSIADALSARVGTLDWRRFPDGESLVAVDDQLQGSDVVLLASLHEPDAMALALRFAAATAREFGARRVGLIAPYLAYMRQDTRFHRGEAVSAPLFARFLQESFDWLVTADPHLHRTADLSVLFSIPAARVATAPLLAEWIRGNVSDGVIIGPDSESDQWVSDVARRAGLPYQVLRKIRRGDRDVEVSLPEVAAVRDLTPVIVDDIVSSGRTVIETVRHVQRLGLRAPVCVAIHAVFAAGAFEKLREEGAARVVSTDSIPHVSNAISIASLLAAASAPLISAVATASYA